MRYAANQRIVEMGDRDYPCIVVKSGEIEVRDESTDPPTTIVVHGPGQFTGGPGVGASAAPRRDSHPRRTVRGLQSLEGSPPPDRQQWCSGYLGDAVLRAPSRGVSAQDSPDFSGVGGSLLQDTFRVRDFLARNRLLFRFLDLESDPDVAQLLASFGMSVSDTPVVAWGRKVIQRNPSNRELAEVAGMRHVSDATVYDLAIVGAGPSGLAAAVYAASEGLATVVLERTAPGGQAGTSMRIENYLGFPTGLTGAELADRAVLQANKFGAILSVETPVIRLHFDGAYPVLELDGGETIVAKCLLIATGADYRRLDVEGCERFEGSGVYYAATFNEAQLCRGADVVVVGGGNSAGQAAVFLASRAARKVYVVIRRDSLNHSMSSYLAHRIEQTPNIEVLPETVVERMTGDDHLARVELLNCKTGEKRTIETPALFSFIGATPRTDWLPPEIETRREAVRPDGAVAGAIRTHDGEAPAVPARDEPAGRVRRRGRALRLSQARRLGRRRGLDGRPVRARVLEGDVGGPGDFRSTRPPGTPTRPRASPDVGSEARRPRRPPRRTRARARCRRVPIVPSSNMRPMRQIPCGTRRFAANFGSGFAGSGAQSLRAWPISTNPARTTSAGCPVKFVIVRISSRSAGTRSTSTFSKMRAISCATMRRRRSACTKSTAERKRDCRKRFGHASGTCIFSWSRPCESVSSSNAAAASAKRIVLSDA